MSDLYSQYSSGTQFTAGAIVGSALGTSGLNPIVDRLNGITNENPAGASEINGSSLYPTINFREHSPIVLVGDLEGDPGSKYTIIADKTISGTSAEYYGTGIVSGTSAEFHGNFQGISAVSGVDFNNGSVISLTNKTSYISIASSSFTPAEPDVVDIHYSNGYLYLKEDNVQLYSPVFLPHNAIITNIIVRGNDSADSNFWYFHKGANTSNTVGTVASGNMSSSSSSFTGSLITNQTYKYSLNAYLDSGNQLWGAVITYTTNYI